MSEQRITTGASPEPWRMDKADLDAILNRVRAGRTLAPEQWKDGARCAVALSFDCDHETYELGSGGKAIGRLQWGEFGRRKGVPRILRILERHGVAATFFVPAITAIIDPGETRRIAEAGHEVGIHGWVHENNSLLDRDTESDLLRRARDVLEQITGKQCRGIRAANWDLSPHSISIAKEMGLIYDSSLMADEDCYELVLDGVPSGLIELPVEWLRDDAAYFMFNRMPTTRPYTPPREVSEIFRREFDAAYDEGGLFQLVMHPFVIGYRSRIWILDEIVRHAKARGHVWFATHADIAQYAWTHSLID
jgi:peptidoglycan-N-acetylglucosamine deacetylase